MSKKKEQDWYWYRWLFWIMVTLTIIYFIFGEDSLFYNSEFLDFIYGGVIIAVFVMSILQIRKYKEKTLAIVGLVISSIMILFVIFLLIFAPEYLEEEEDLEQYCTENLYNCADFTSQSDAQLWLDYCKSLGYGDVHYLDGDEDGVACENLP